MSQKEFWILVLIIALIIAFVVNNNINKIVSGKNGGILSGPSHKDGGIDAIIRSSGGKISLEGEEAIINKRSMGMNVNIVCEGTPSGVASAVNELGGGLQFDANGRCYIIN